MRRERVRGIIEHLLGEMEEEDIGISLLSIYSQNEDDLRFFKDEDRARMLQILKILSDDSKKHKGILERIVKNLGMKNREK